MKRNRRPLPIPQYEFIQAAQAFNLHSETTSDGERIAREMEAKRQAQREADAAQFSLFHFQPQTTNQ
jgi:hypothetical protein